MFFDKRVFLSVLFFATGCASVVDDRLLAGGEGGHYKVGSSYEINGKRHHPHENPYYTGRGIASWYGEDFHGKKTANGEIFDMNLLTAAHPTLPLPVYVRVRNVENSRSVIVRVNDRGPFRKNRVIDLSRAAAGRLGFVEKGTALVEIEYLGRAKIGVKGKSGARYLIQAGAFSSRAGAERAAAGLKDLEAPLRVTNGGSKWLLRLGPFEKELEAEAVLAVLRVRKGYEGAFIKRGGA